jgi:CheY-like chemotaxis protein
VYYVQAKDLIMAAHKILVFVDDLFFSAKIGEVIRQLGGKPVITANMEGIFERLEPDGPTAIVVDLGLMGADAVDIIAQLKKQSGTMDVPMMAFGRHTSPDVLARASEAGCEQVMPRSDFVKRLPGFLKDSM